MSLLRTSINRHAAASQGRCTVATGTLTCDEQCSVYERGRGERETSSGMWADGYQRVEPVLDGGRTDEGMSWVRLIPLGPLDGNQVMWRENTQGSSLKKSIRIRGQYYDPFVQGLGGGWSE